MRPKDNFTTRSAAVAAVAALAITLTGCTGGAVTSDAKALGEGVTVEVGKGVHMSFAIDDVRTGTLEDLKTMGVQGSPGADGQAAYFVSYSVTLTDGNIADADRNALPVPTTDEWKLVGAGTYQPLKILLGDFDCTPERNASNTVAPDAPLIACQAFLGPENAMPTTVKITHLGSWVIPT